MKKEENLLYDVVKTRTIILSSAIDDKLATRVIQELLILEKKAVRPIQMIINSPGGQVTSGMAIYDIMQLLQSPIYTIVAGIAASMGTILAVGGAQNYCMITSNSRYMIHQPLLHGVVGKASDLQITAEEIKKTKLQIAEIYAKKTKKKSSTILQVLEQDRWFSAKEALDYGLTDKIIDRFPLEI
jgi:ATP-dependent Clp protease protease subunit